MPQPTTSDDPLASGAHPEPLGALLARLETTEGGLSTAEAASRLARYGPNAVRSHRVRPLAVLVRQVRSPLLGLLAVAGAVSFFVGQRADAVIIGVIITASVALGFVNELRAERASDALHATLQHRSAVRRDGHWTSCDITELVTGDLVRIEMGQVVPADLRLTEAIDLECDESVLTGESSPVEKRANAAPGADPALACCSMGTIVHAGSGVGLVVATGTATVFGRIAVSLGEGHEETEFEAGLRQFSMLLARVAAVLTTVIFAINLVLARPLVDAVLFSLAIAVGITPQLLPAVVTTSLGAGARRLARKKVLVKRLVCIEDLGDVEVLLTDKTGTLTEGAITFADACDPPGDPSRQVLLLGLVCNEAVIDDDGTFAAGNPLDIALWHAATVDEAARATAGFRRVAAVPFDHDRRIVSVLVDGPDGRTIVAKGAPEAILQRCREVPNGFDALLTARFAAGARLVAVAARPAAALNELRSADEYDLEVVGFLAFVDQPKASAAAALARLAHLGVTVKIVTGDNPAVAEHVCAALGLATSGTLTGHDLAVLDDDALTARLATTTIFARVDPEQKSRIVRLHRSAGHDVAYLGDGVNDAVALHKADVGISVEGATDVARDAADIILLEKDLDVLADGVVEGRRTFANTIKYVLMGTSSNFGNMFSAAAASAFLPFLPLLPSQILLNNLLYDIGQLTIPSDRVDADQLARPAHWDIGFVRRFMTVFGPVSSLFDFLTFAVMLQVFNAGPALFRAGWFVESLATQSLVIFVIRTRRIPFFTSRASRPLAAGTALVVAAAVALPLSPLAATLGFDRPPLGFYAALVLMVLAYLALVEATKHEFYAHLSAPVSQPRPKEQRRLHRRAARFSHRGNT